MKPPVGYSILGIMHDTMNCVRVHCSHILSPPVHPGEMLEQSRPSASCWKCLLTIWIKYKDLTVCREINQSSKQIFDYQMGNPMFLIRKEVYSFEKELKRLDDIYWIYKEFQEVKSHQFLSVCIRNWRNKPWPGILPLIT